MEEVTIQDRNTIKGTIHDKVAHGSAHLAMNLVNRSNKIIPGTLITKSIIE